MKDDTISRQTAIDVFYKYPNIHWTTLEVMTTIEELPSVKSERKRGEWVKNEDRCGWHCSCCKVDNNYAYSWNPEIGRNEFQDNFCPNCGADMRKGEDK